MGLRSEISALFNARINTGNVRMVQYPNTAAGVNIVSNNAAAADAFMANTVVIVAAAALANPVWIVGIQLGLPQVEAFQATISLYIGLADTEIGRFDVGTNVFAVAEWTYPTILFPHWFFVPNSPRLHYNIRKSTIASLAGFNRCHIIALTGVGS